jgi:transcriptional regulator with XRE-family HTH domain
MEQPFRVVGQRLAATREALGITQAERCRRLRVDPPRWNQYEVGKRRITIEVALALRLAFGVTLDWIYVGDSSRSAREITASNDNSMRAAQLRRPSGIVRTWLTSVSSGFHWLMHG